MLGDQILPCSKWGIPRGVKHYGTTLNWTNLLSISTISPSKMPASSEWLILEFKRIIIYHRDSFSSHPMWYYSIGCDKHARSKMKKAFVDRRQRECNFLIIIKSIMVETSLELVFLFLFLVFFPLVRTKNKELSVMPHQKWYGNANTDVSGSTFLYKQFELMCNQVASSQIPLDDKEFIRSSKLIG